MLDGRRRLPAWGFCCLLRLSYGQVDFSMAAGATLLRRLMLLHLMPRSLTRNRRQGRRRGVRSNLRGKGEILAMGDMRSRRGRCQETGLETDLETGRETGLQMFPDMGMGSRVRRCVRRIRCGLRRRRGICRSGWPSTRTSLWSSRSAC